jgi:hypothetical protein
LRLLITLTWQFLITDVNLSVKGVHYFHVGVVCQDGCGKRRGSKKDCCPLRFNPTTDACGAVESERNIKCSVINFRPAKFLFGRFQFFRHD